MQSLSTFPKEIFYIIRKNNPKIPMGIREDPKLPKQS